MTSPEELGAEIRAAREAAGLSGRALAEAAGIHESRLRQIEKGYESRGGGEFRIPVKTTARTLRGLLDGLGEHAGPLLREAAGPDQRDALLGRIRDGDVLPLDGLDAATKEYLRTIAEEARRRNPEAR